MKAFKNKYAYVIAKTLLCILLVVNNSLVSSDSCKDHNIAMKYDFSDADDADITTVNHATRKRDRQNAIKE